MNELATISNAMDLWEDETKLEEIKAIFAPKLNKNEFNAFIGMGKANDLNPFTREIWAIKYADNAPAQIFIGRDGYRKSAQRNPDYKCHIVEAIYENDDFRYNNGAISHSFGMANRGKLLGAYCLVYKKSVDMPIHVICELKDYSTGKSLWNAETGKQATMIKKCAEAQALRMAFQEQYAGTYSEYEKHDVIDAVWEPKPTQQDKLNSLLAKKGLTNATVSKNSNNTANPSNSSNDVQQFNADFNIQEPSGQGAIRPNMAEIRAQEDSTPGEADDFVPCTKEQLDDLEFKMQFAGFDDSRRVKALKHFKVSTFPELSFEQANEMIKIVEKA